MSNIGIVGCGASAMMCALNISSNNQITIFSKDDKICKKILVTGNGRCNLTNKNINNNCYNCELSDYLEKFDNKKTIDYFSSLGLETYSDDEGRVYPISNSASSVQEIFEREIQKRKNIKVLLNEEVVKISQTTDFKFVVNDKYTFDKIVIATGPNKQILDMLKINYQAFIPSLMALKTKENTKRMSGLRLSNVCVSFENYKEKGEILFKDDGLSGICIFNISSFLARNNNFDKKIFVDLLPDVKIEYLTEKLINRKKLQSKTMTEFMQGLFHKEINKYILKVANINQDLCPNNLKNEDIVLLASLIKKLEFNTCAYYDNNQIYSGGVLLSDLTPTLMHKKIKNLYFIGEICNVDGICGGYNLQWAWTSGKIVGDSL